jgi:hypothetical protein
MINSLPVPGRGSEPPPNPAYIVAKRVDREAVSVEEEVVGMDRY